MCRLYLSDQHRNIYPDDPDEAETYVMPLLDVNIAVYPNQTEDSSHSTETRLMTRMRKAYQSSDISHIENYEEMPELIDQISQEEMEEGIFKSRDSKQA